MQIFGKSDIGLKRESNQDVFYYFKFDENFCFAFVCDGMGGQNGGDIASNMVLNYFSTNIKKRFRRDLNDEEIKELIFDFYREVNEMIYDEAKSKECFKGMGTTCATVVIKDNKMMIFNVGDSRVYIKSDENLKQLTVDHSYVQILVDCGKITKKEAISHPRKNEITKAVGIVEDINIDYEEVEVFKEDLVLLCTDGLTNSCSDLEISGIIKEDIEKSVEDLIDRSNINGGKDNITVILIKI